MAHNNKENAKMMAEEFRKLLNCDEPKNPLLLNTGTIIKGGKVIGSVLFPDEVIKCIECLYQNLESTSRVIWFSSWTIQTDKHCEPRV